MNPESTLSRIKDAIDKDPCGPKATSLFSSLPMPWFDASSSRTTTTTEKNVSILKPFLRSSPVDYEGDKPPSLKRFNRINTFSIDDEDEAYIAEENPGPCDHVPFKNPEYPRSFLDFPNRGGAESGHTDVSHHDKKCSPAKLHSTREHLSQRSDDLPRKKIKFEHDSKRKDTTIAAAAKSVLVLNTPSDNDLPKAKHGITVATPPGSPVSNFPIITPGVTPQVVSVPTWDLDLQSIFCDDDKKYHQQTDKQEFNRKNTVTNNSKPDYLSHPSKQNTDEKYYSLLTGPYPLSMKPIIRILLHLDDTSTERQKARKAFHVVQGCYKRHKLGEKRFRDLNGTIFEALVEELGVDLGKIFQASQSYSSPKLDTFFDTPDSSAPPSSVELAISYGVHMARMNPDLENFEDMIRDGAGEFKSMSEEELSGSWRSWVVNPTLKPN
jgi:hypothetical protein